MYYGINIIKVVTINKLLHPSSYGSLVLGGKAAKIYSFNMDPKHSIVFFSLVLLLHIRSAVLCPLTYLLPFTLSYSTPDNQCFVALELRFLGRKSHNTEESNK